MRKPKKGRKRRGASPALLEMISSDFWWSIMIGEIEADEPSIEDLRNEWERHRDEALTYHLQHSPYKPCWGYWRFEHNIDVNTMDRAEWPSLISQEGFRHAR
jgi:hypothetical protein